MAATLEDLLWTAAAIRQEVRAGLRGKWEAKNPARNVTATSGGAGGGTPRGPMTERQTSTHGPMPARWPDEPVRTYRAGS